MGVCGVPSSFVNVVNSTFKYELTNNNAIIIIITVIIVMIKYDEKFLKN